MAETPDLGLADLFPRGSVPPDLSVPTWQVHQETDPERQQCCGPFGATRASLDQQFHGHYTVERQRVQDSLVARCLEFGGRSASGGAPWLIFTCGAMGVGKGWALRHLHEMGSFPRNHFCLIDPDRFRMGLPETSAYIAQQLWRNLGAHTQREAGYLSEVALQECLKQSRNCVYDSSLRDAGFWTERINQIRTNYPRYRLAIYFITAPDNVIFDRALERAKQTGRYIPADVLQDAIYSAPRAFDSLKGIVDFTAVIDTSGKLPEVVSPAAEVFSDHRNELTNSRDTLLEMYFRKRLRSKL